MGALEHRLALPHSLSLPETVTSHGWANLAPWQWDRDKGVLSRLDRLSSGERARITVTQGATDAIAVAAEGDGIEHTDLDEAVQLVRRWLSVDWDPSRAVSVAREVAPEVGAYIADGGGRLLRASTFYEDFVKTVCTIQIAWSGTRRMVSALIDSIGHGLFPTPVQVLAAGESGLKELGRVGFRARVIYEATGTMLDRGSIDDLGNDVNGMVGYDEMIGLRGIGPYAATHMTVLQHDFSRIPIDSEVARHCREAYGLEPDQIDDFFEPWGDFRFLGYRIGEPLKPA